MTDAIEIRESVLNDISSIEKLYPEAFPDEDLRPLVAELLKNPPVVLSLVGIIEASLVGHVMFTTCRIDGKEDKVALLGPLAVVPAWQRQGIGSTLVGAGLERLKKDGTSRIYVLGDPAYYARFGFLCEISVTPPYSLPEEWHDAWQSLNLRIDLPPISGKLAVPEPWRSQSLWLP